MPDMHLISSNLMSTYIQAGKEANCFCLPTRQLTNHIIWIKVLGHFTSALNFYLAQYLIYRAQADGQVLASIPDK